MCFPTPGCAICKYSGIVAIQNTVQQTPGRGLVYIALGGVFIEDPVKTKSLIFRSFTIAAEPSSSLYSMLLWRIKDSMALFSLHMRVGQHGHTSTCRLQPSIPAVCL